MIIEEVDDWDNLFEAVPGPAQKVARQERARKERRTQLTDKQRNRTAVRTTQINFRCSPAFKDQALRVSRQLKISVADLMEQALAEFVERMGEANAD